MAMPWKCFCLDFALGQTTCGTVLLAVATGTTISCSLGRHFGPGLSFLEIYGSLPNFNLVLCIGNKTEWLYCGLTKWQIDEVVS
jgi:hypothetical protein